VRRWSIAILGAWCVSVIAAPAAEAQCGWAWSAGTPLVSTRTEAAMVYDSVRGRVVLVGGYLSDGTMSSGTFDYDGTTWRNVSPIGNPRPLRAGHAMAFDSHRGVVVLFGGGTDSGGLSATTFEYDGLAWRIVTTPASPSARRGHAMAYDSSRQVVVLFGGQTASGRVGDTWEYNGATWTQRAVTGPTARSRHVMVYNEALQKVVVVGGETSLQPPPNHLASGTWGWDGAAWSLIAGSGPMRTRAAGAYSTARQRMVIIGGASNVGVTADVWEFGPGGWQLLEVAGPNANRVDSCLVFDPQRGAFIAASGTDGSNFLQDSKLLSPGGGLTVQASPAVQQVSAGQTAVFSAEVNGMVTAWQWRKGGVALGNDARVSGATTANLTIQGVTDADTGSYDVVATSACGALVGGPLLLGVVPACGTSDFNGDGDFGTDQDIEAFFACLAGNCCGTCYPGGSDFNGDGDFGTDQDIESFFRVLGGSAC